MKIQAVVGVVIGAVAVAGAAYAQMRPLGGALDTYTFPDGTEVRSAYVGVNGTNTVNVIQIKKTNGEDCYAVVGSSGQNSSIYCSQ